MKKIGILGGTFDPVHMGHLSLAENAYKQYKLDEVWFMTAPNPPHKSTSHVSPFEDRFNMVTLAVKDKPDFFASDFENHLEGASYTARTVTELKKLFPEDEFCLLVGLDSFYEIEKWYHPEIILSEVTLLAAPREYDKEHTGMLEHKAHLEEKYGARIGLIDAEEIDISSTGLRGMLEKGLYDEVSGLLPERVLSYIKDTGMYLKNEH